VEKLAILGKCVETLTATEMPRQQEAEEPNNEQVLYHVTPNACNPMWWPGMNHKIEEMVKHGTECQQMKPMPPSSQLCP